MKAFIIEGASHSDLRGYLKFNNTFDLSLVKRMYTIENATTEFVRGWQGHRIEKRWFSVVNGSFEITLIKINDWKNPHKDLEQRKFHLTSKKLDVLYVPEGHITSIRSVVEKSVLLIMADHVLDEIDDEYRFESNYFLTKNN